MIHLTTTFSTIALGGFNPLAAATGIIIFFQIFQIFYYGLPQNEPKAGFGLDPKSTNFTYRWRQFIGVQLVTVLIASSAILAGPDKIFFPFKFFS